MFGRAQAQRRAQVSERGQQHWEQNLPAKSKTRNVNFNRLTFRSRIEVHCTWILWNADRGESIKIITKYYFKKYVNDLCIAEVVRNYSGSFISHSIFYIYYQSLFRKDHWENLAEFPITSSHLAVAKTTIKSCAVPRCLPSACT